MEKEKLKWYIKMEDTPEYDIVRQYIKKESRTDSWQFHQYYYGYNGRSAVNGYDYAFEDGREFKDCTLINNIQEFKEKVMGIKKELPKYFVIKLDKSNPLWNKYIKWLNNCYAKSTAWAGDCYSYYGYDGSEGVGGSSGQPYLHYFENNPALLTLEEWDSIVNPKEQNNMKEKEIIGYRLIKPEYVQAACKIEGYISFGEGIIDGKPILLSAAYTDMKKAFKKLEKAGVLDLWFEPVYKSQEEVYNMGGFNLTIKPEGIFHKNENITKFVKEMIEKFTSTSFQFFSFGGYQANAKEILFSKTGCESSETRLSQWKAVYEIYKKMQ